MGLARLRPPPTAKAQVTLIGAICFCCPGIYNAVTAMAGGIADPEVVSYRHVVLFVLVMGCPPLWGTGVVTRRSAGVPARGCARRAWVVTSLPLCGHLPGASRLAVVFE